MDTAASTTPGFWATAAQARVRQDGRVEVAIMSDPRPGSRVMTDLATLTGETFAGTTVLELESAAEELLKANGYTRLQGWVEDAAMMPAATIISDAQPLPANFIEVDGSGDTVKWRIMHDFEPETPWDGLYVVLASGAGAGDARGADVAGDRVLREQGLRRVGAWRWIDTDFPFATIERIDADTMVTDCPQCGAEADEACREHCTAPEGESL